MCAVPEAEEERFSRRIEKLAVSNTAGGEEDNRIDH